MDTESTPALPSGSAQTSETVSRYSYYALSVLTLVNFLNYIDRQVLPAVAPAIQRELGLTDTELGAMEAALLLSFAVLAPLFGRLGDRYSRTKLMASAAIIWSIATALTGVMDHFPVLPGSVHINLPLVKFTLELSCVAVVL